MPRGPELKTERLLKTDGCVVVSFHASLRGLVFTWNTKQFCALLTMPIFSSSSTYLAWLTRSPSREYSDESPANGQQSVGSRQSAPWVGLSDEPKDARWNQREVN